MTGSEPRFKHVKHLMMTVPALGAAFALDVLAMNLPMWGGGCLVAAGIAYRHLRAAGTTVGKLVEGLNLALALFVGIAIAGCVIANFVAKDRNTDRLVATVERYEEDHGRYPERLDVLVPEYLSEIPRAGVIGGHHTKFEYYEYEGKHFLIVVNFGFHKCTYSFEERTRSCFG